MVVKHVIMILHKYTVTNFYEIYTCTFDSYVM